MRAHRGDVVPFDSLLSYPYSSGQTAFASPSYDPIELEPDFFLTIRHYLNYSRNGVIPQMLKPPSDGAVLAALNTLIFQDNNKTTLTRTHPITLSQLVHMRDMDKETELTRFPLKKDRQASIKVCAYARDVIKSSVLPPTVLAVILALPLFNDQVCSFIIWAELAAKIGLNYELIAYALATLVYNKDHLKHISDWIKCAGIATSDYARIFVEMDSLMGRGVPSKTAEEDREHRVNGNPNPHEAKVSPEILRRNIQRIYAREFVNSPPIEDFTAHIYSAPLWCKKGAHHHPDFPKYANRLEFVLNTDPELIIKSAPRTFIKQAPKLELGKTRWIYNCDTISYLFFDYILNYVEGNWANESCILDPSTVPPARTLRETANGATMLDFTDFNSQHSIASMQMVFEELRPYIPVAGQAVLDWCVESFRNMYHYEPTPNCYPPVMKRHWTSTLPSGHRATTFINTILNRAYILDLIGEVKSFHTGDDVLLCRPLDPTSLINKNRVELNPSKQSYGRNGEFLRTVLAHDRALGYPCRAIGTFVSGNWLTDIDYTQTNSLTTQINQLNTINSRAGLEWGVLPCYRSTLLRRYTIYREIGPAVNRAKVSGSGLVSLGLPDALIACTYATNKQSSIPSTVIDRVSSKVTRYTDGRLITKTALKDKLCGRTAKPAEHLTQYTYAPNYQHLPLKIVCNDDLYRSKIHRYLPRSLVPPDFQVTTVGTGLIATDGSLSPQQALAVSGQVSYRYVGTKLKIMV